MKMIVVIIITLLLVGCPQPTQVVQVQNDDGTVSTVSTTQSIIKTRYLGRLKSGSNVDVYADDTNGNVCYMYNSYGISCVPNTNHKSDYKNAEQP